MKKEKIKLFRDLLLCRPKKPDEKTHGGIIIPDEAKDESRYLEVLEVGSKIWGIKPGDTIITIGQCPGGQDFEFNGERLVIMRDKYVFGVVEK
jgi:co-chaperonin GroES (HSP10)